MKFKFSLSIAGIILGMSLSSADILTLKDGNQYSGKLLSETEEAYLFRVQVTRSIKEERSFKKSEVATLEKDDPAKIEYKELKKYRTTPDMMTSSDYKAALTKLTSFIKKYPKSDLLETVKNIQTKIKDESERVTKGGVKLDGRWYDLNDQKLEQFDFDAATLIHKAKESVANRKVKEALIHLDTYQENFLGASSTEEALKLKSTTLKQYQIILRNTLKESTALQQRREKGLKNLSGSDKKRTMQAVERETKAYERLIDKEVKKNIKWLSINPYDDKIIKDQLKAVTDEIKKTDQLDPSSYPELGDQYKKAQTALSNGQLDDAKAAISELKKNKLPKKYADGLDASLQAMTAETAP